MDSEVEAQLEEMVEGTNRDLDWAKAEFEKAMDEVEERLMEDVSDDVKVELAMGVVDTDRLFSDRVGGGEEMEIDILAIGQAGRIDNWGPEDKSVVYGYAFIHGPLRDDGESKAARAVLINDGSTGLDLGEVQRKFHALNTMRATYSVREANDLKGVYQCWSTGKTNLEEVELDSLPADRDGKNGILRKAIPEVTLATLTENLSSHDPDTGYTHDFGADLRRIRGRVVDYYIPDDRSWGRYTILDESMTEDDVEQAEWSGDDANIPGLTVWADPEYHMEYGRRTIADFYGTIEWGENGNIVMNLVGVVPVAPWPMDESEEQADANVNTTEESI